MPEKKNPNIDTYKVLTGDWYSVIQIENNTGNPSINTLNKLAKVLGVEIEFKIISK